MYIGISLMHTSRGIGKRWRKTYATIVRINKIEYNLSNHPERIAYNYDIKFYDCNGKEKEAKNRVIHCSHGHHNIGDLVAIWYNPDNSDEVSDRMGKSLAGKILTTIGVSLILVSGIILLVASNI